jgi:hypothetical protein
MNKFILLIVLTFSFCSFAVEEVKDKYPFFRQFRSGFNITFGTLSIYNSVQILNDSDSTNKEKNFSYILTGIGVMRLIDGFYYIVTKSLPEDYQARGKLDKSNKNFKRNLKEAVAFERKLRKYRATVILLNGVGFLGVYTEDPEKNKLSLLPAIGMLTVSAYAYFAKAPAEKAYERLYNLPQVGFNAVRIYDKNLFYPQVSFRF